MKTRFILKRTRYEIFRREDVFKIMCFMSMSADNRDRLNAKEIAYQAIDRAMRCNDTVPETLGIFSTVEEMGAFVENGMKRKRSPFNLEPSIQKNSRRVNLIVGGLYYCDVEKFNGSDWKPTDDIGYFFEYGEPKDCLE